MNKFAVKVGWLPVSALLFLLSLAMIVAVLIWDQARVNQIAIKQEGEYQQQTFDAIRLKIKAEVDGWQSQLKTIATADVTRSLRFASIDQLQQWQELHLANVPDAEKLCFLADIPTSPDAAACIPISFATLNALRQVKDNGVTDVALIQADDDSHILIAHSVLDSEGNFQGAVLMGLDPSKLDELIPSVYVQKGYVELSQGKGSGLVITRSGDPRWKQGQSSFNQSVDGTYWKINYWPKHTSVSSNWLAVIIILLISAIFWVLQQLWLRKLISHDADSLHQQVADFGEKSLKPSYQLSFSAFSSVADKIHHLAAATGGVKTKVAAKPVQRVELSEASVAPQDVEAVAKQNTETQEELREPESEAPSMSISPIPAENMLEEAELDPAIFKAYDIRGIVDKQLDDDVMYQVGQAAGSEALDQGQHQFVVGCDGRLSSNSLSKAFIKGVLASGCDVIDVGQVPTPVVYFACEHLGTHSGAVVTGSHNPAEYNGVKIVIAGKTLAGDDIKKLYERISNGQLKNGQGRVEKQEVTSAYIERVTTDIKIARKMNVVVDCGNGVAGTIVPKVLRQLGCEVTELFCDVDGNFPNHHPNPGQPENLQALIEAVKSNEAELGIAFDGDGDRLGVVDGHGEIIWPDRLLILLAQHLLVEQPGAAIIYDVKSTAILEDVISRAGGQPIMSPSGHSLIKNKMSEVDAKLAGEMSGHIFFRDRWYGFDDALYSAARLLEFLAVDPLERTPTEVFSALPKRYTTPEILFEMAPGESHEFVEQLKNKMQFENAKITKIDGVRADFPNGWGLVRASNTMPGLVFRFEANSEEELEHIKQLFIQQMLQVKPTLSILL